MKGFRTVTRVGVVCAALVSAVATSSWPARSRAAPVPARPATAPAGGGRTVSLAETQQAEAVLKQLGLTQVGFTYLVPADVKLRDGLGKMRQAKSKLDAYVAKRKQLERDIADADAAVAAANARLGDAANRLARANRNAADYNQYVARFNAARPRVDEAERYRAACEKALKDLPQPTGDYAGALIELADAMDEAARQYDTLAADPAVTAALAQINLTARPQVKLGPSAQFAQELRPVRFLRDQLAAQAIPVKVGKNNLAIVQVKLNDAEPVDMVFDSGASVISLSAEAAKRAGIVPGPRDPTIKTYIANGAAVECRLVHARSVRVGPFILHDVECTVAPASDPNTPLLLGGSFQKNFVVRLDLGAGQLHLTPIVKTKAVAKDPLAAAAPKTVGLANGRTEVTVAATRNEASPAATGVKLVVGQAFTLSPSTADRWHPGDGPADSSYDYKGDPAKPGRMRLKWKLGEESGDVTPGQAVVAKVAGELLLYCYKGRVAGNTGSIRVTVAPGPLPAKAKPPTGASSQPE